MKANQPKPNATEAFVPRLAKDCAKISTFAEFETWIEAQLEVLEGSFEEFSTANSQRKFFSR